MQILGKNGVKGLNGLGYVLGLSNGGPWYCVAIYPERGIVVDPTNGRRERAVIYGGRELNEYRTSITFAPIADALSRIAGDFTAKVSFDGRFLSASVIKDGIKNLRQDLPCNRDRLGRRPETGRTGCSQGASQV